MKLRVVKYHCYCLVLLALIAILSSCDLEIIPDNFEGGPVTGAPIACFSVDRSSCTIGDCSIQFNASCSTGAMTYRWDFDNNGTFELEGTGERMPSFNFTSVGDFTIRLEVQDDRNRLHDTTMSITVNAMPTPTYENTDAARGVANGLTVLPDGGLLMAGITDGDIFLRRTNEDGDVTLDRTYSDSNSDIANDVTLLSDGTYVVVGSAFNNVLNRTDALFLRTKPNGDPLVGPVRLPNVINRNMTLVRVIELGDGSILMVGFETNTITGNTDMYLQRNSSELNGLFFEKTIALPDNEIPQDAIAIDDGFIVVGINNSNSGGDPKGLFARFDLAGNLAVGHPLTFAGNNGQSFNGITAMGSNDFLVAGLTVPTDNTDVVFLRTNADGVVQAGYPKVIGGAQNESASSCHATADGGAILAGEQGADALLLKIDASGNEEWRIADAVNNNDAYRRVAAMPDGGYAVCGYRGSSLYYAKTNNEGRVE